MKRDFSGFRKVVSGMLLTTLSFSFIAPWSSNIVLADNPAPAFTTSETQAAGSGTSAVVAQIIDGIEIF